MKSSIYSISVIDISGNNRTLSEYAGKVLLIVNVASKCGFTSQYSGLQELNEKFLSKGLIICGFPSNDFANQELGSEQDIQEFCSLNFGVSFPMFSKVKVKGKEIHPLFDYLTKHDTYGGRIMWNFSKFLINRTGVVSDRFAPFTKPTSRRMLKAVETLLDQ